MFSMGFKSGDSARWSSQPHDPLLCEKIFNKLAGITNTGRIVMDFGWYKH